MMIPLDQRRKRSEYADISKRPRVSLCRNFDPFRVAPQAFERVELPRRGRAAVEDEIEVVDEDPLCPIVALDERRLRAAAAERLLDGVGDRLDLPDVGPGADDEEIGERRCLAEIEHEHVERLLLERGGDSGGQI